MDRIWTRLSDADQKCIIFWTRRILLLSGWSLHMYIDKSLNRKITNSPASAKEILITFFIEASLFDN